MNIFVLDEDHNLNAQFHCDKHVIKMVLEYAQILSTTRHLFGESYVPYKPTHKNHPCVKWCAESLSNYIWLTNLGIALSNEYTYRYGRIHKSGNVILSMTVPPIMEDKGLTPFALAMNDYCKTKDPVESYRNYYINEKKHIASWKNRSIPYWWF